MTPEELDAKRDREYTTIHKMIRMYCNGHNHTLDADAELCPECAALSQYAYERLQACPRMEEKTFCSSCPIHCYSADMRARVKEVMAWAGPRMMLYDPKGAMRHLIDTKRAAKRMQG